ncbi:DNA-directed RNA polymerase, omega subunit family protein (macronuclear) [Tetrahymena thermophila SB210]|uniref:DNA-directed RNA polymerase, omega subunit family protein n=1 Tax=Tetrahymena thermophila (strain SB210) TaxID=312017 RepID=W7XIG0_TETTS|nr:DNA-directed RNA polymerase, omega subunit family protein [Tetrahymena thermophila SB210]EWS74611.1 DNA-directed RNA polymerase, omega subunit family protein [Tetrahymena thermophila SB210]|eukprot:XP_012652833.1 DNA-directed RNA polymerase, omega subunit family protein [Tetrahymena thermophila SB210]
MTNPSEKLSSEEDAIGYQSAKRYEDQIRELQEEIQKRTREKEQLRTEKEIECIGLKQEMDRLQKLCDRLTEQEESQKQLKEVLEDHKNDAIQKLNKEKEKNKEMKKYLEEAHQEIEQLRKNRHEKHEKDGDNDHHQRKLSSKEDEEDAVYQKYKELEEKLTKILTEKKQLEDQNKSLQSELQNKSIYDNESFYEFQNKLLKSKQELEDKIELEQQLEICLERLVNEGELDLMDLNNSRICNNLVKIQQNFKEFYQFKEKFGSKHQDELKKIAQTYQSQLIVKEKQIKELQKYKEMYLKPVLNSEENRDPFNCTKIKIQQKELHSRPDTGRKSEMSNGQKDEQLEYQMLEIESLKNENILLKSEIDQLKQELEDNEQIQNNFMAEQRRKNKELQEKEQKIQELISQQNQQKIQSSNRLNMSSSNLNSEVTKMRQQMEHKDKLIQQLQSQINVTQDSSIKHSLKALFPTYIDSLLNSKDKKISQENDSYLTLILNMLEYSEKEKNEIKQKMDKAKNQKGGFLGFFKN